MVVGPHPARRGGGGAWARLASAGNLGRNGFYFQQLHSGNRARFDRLVSEHSHAVNAAVSGLSALPGTAKPFASTRAMTRLLNNEDVPFHALIEPAQDAVRGELAAKSGEFVLIVHDWCMFNFNKHTSKTDRLLRSHKNDLGYELGTALAVDADDGRPLGSMEFRLRTGEGMLSTRVGGAARPRGHIDEIAAVMADAQRWNLPHRLVHVIDREADSVGHYREWHAAGRRFLVRSDESRLVRHDGRERKLDDVAADLRGRMRDVCNAAGLPEVVMIRGKAGRVRVAEAEVILHRPARHNTGEKTAAGSKKQVEIPGPPLPLRLVVAHVVDEMGVVLAEWRLLTNVPAEDADAATIGRWYAHRWGIETYHKLLKSSGMNAEAWQQESGAAFLRRLCVASMACLTVWHLQREESEEAGRLREALVRLSGRQMKHRVESTAPALLAGLERLLAIDDLMQREDLEDILALARRVIPRLFPDRSG